MEHTKIKDLFASYLDGFLSHEEIILVEEHLQHCPDCQKELNDIKETMRLLSTLPEEEPPFDIAASVRQKIKTDVKHKGFFKKIDYRFLSVAAAFILMIGISYIDSNFKMGSTAKDEALQPKTSELRQNLADQDINQNFNSANLAKAKVVQEQSEMPNTDQKSLARDEANQAEMLYATDDIAAKQQQHSLIQPKIIKNADVELKIKNYESFSINLLAHLEQKSGYVENSALNKNSVTKRQAGSMIVRIPENNFQETVDFLKTLGEFQRLNINSNDVTTQYIDTDAKIKTLKAQITALQNLLAKAKTVEEMLNIQKELTRVQGEHDSLVSQNRYLDRAVSYSTIVISIYEEDFPQDKITPSEDRDILSKAKAGFIRSVNRIIKITQQLFVAFVTFLPQIFVTLLLVTFFVIFLKIKKRK